MLNAVGTIRLGTNTDISDPSFSWVDWKKMSVPTEEGVYNCYVEKDAAGNISSIEIAREDAGITEEDWQSSSKMGFVSSRSGLCGFFNNKPDYSKQEWEEISDALYLKNSIDNSDVYFAPTRNGDAFYTSSGKNGSYLVRGCKRKGRYYALRLVFNEG